MDAHPESQIVASVLTAISEQRLPAGTKLGEQALSDIFNCNRANVRRALASLAAKHVVEVRPNRGAFVATPSAEEAREVFQARRAIERTIARQAVARITPEDVAWLRANVAAESDSHQRQDKPAALRLSQRFHMRLAELAGNRVLERFLSELTMRSTLILGMYSSGDHPCVSREDHGQIIDALEARDEERLLALTDAHLRHLEAELNFDVPLVASLSLKDRLAIPEALAGSREVSRAGG